jgi:tripartite-type tricarboxylate transporter receptor subunit TctC
MSAVMQREIARIVELPDVKDKMATIGLDTGGRSSAEFAAYVRADSGRR